MFATFANGMLEPLHQAIWRVILCQYIQARNLLQSSWLWPRGLQAQVAVARKSTLVGCDLPSYMNRCNLDKDVQLIPVKTRSFI